MEDFAALNLVFDPCFKLELIEFTLMDKLSPSEAVATLNQIESNVVKCFDKLNSCQTQLDQNHRSDKPNNGISTNQVALFENEGLDSSTPIRMPKKIGVQPLRATLERRAEAARPSPHAARHLHAFNRRAGVQPCQTGVQSLHACLEGRAKPARPSDRRAGFARLSAHVSLSIQEAYVSQRTLKRVPKYPYKGTKVPL
ncbi:hypothetical protein PCANC_15052 [Puccinia coronata f. sp. avenae]|uniref:Uncharacterized protein n=1 Tax=Puccinia coronata f. sp. avenae TaxID=200324 RepID=A0A2N5UAI2_9BASI|nr:hypothetical protein PCASD_16784 [Puccinia coronata f. sp. avenae]PLW34733.1 hypothetical protein PCANC_15052 [Puccinia coronata f. sp. avenae]